ncbi:hypothetical protein B9Z55_026370 [Caenorhabditis nigoni]|uniref:Uncharacterized protein n=1 Tax=Caenorhabditis nigoni TaxID=1611254 RepID=A0A2G5T346_9PELO|nr:hypothetical protein B9Z55_026370 [Caenorhabditis nigoni]
MVTTRAQWQGVERKINYKETATRKRNNPQDVPVVQAAKRRRKANGKAKTPEIPATQNGPTTSSSTTQQIDFARTPSPWAKAPVKASSNVDFEFEPPSSRCHSRMSDRASPWKLPTQKLVNKVNQWMCRIPGAITITQASPPKTPSPVRYYSDDDVSLPPRRTKGSADTIKNTTPEKVVGPIEEFPRKPTPPRRPPRKRIPYERRRTCTLTPQRPMPDPKPRFKSKKKQREAAAAKAAAMAAARAAAAAKARAARAAAKSLAIAAKMAASADPGTSDSNPAPRPANGVANGKARVIQLPNGDLIRSVNGKHQRLRPIYDTAAGAAQHPGPSAAGTARRPGPSAAGAAQRPGPSGAGAAQRPRPPANGAAQRSGPLTAGAAQRPGPSTAGAAQLPVKENAPDAPPGIRNAAQPPAESIKKKGSPILLHGPITSWKALYRSIRKPTSSTKSTRSSSCGIKFPVVLMEEETRIPNPPRPPRRRTSSDSFLIQMKEIDARRVKKRAEDERIEKERKEAEEAELKRLGLWKPPKPPQVARKFTPRPLIISNERVGPTPSVVTLSSDTTKPPSPPPKIVLPEGFEFFPQSIHILNCPKKKTPVKSISIEV